MKRYKAVVFALLGMTVILYCVAVEAQDSNSNTAGSTASSLAVTTTVENNSSASDASNATTSTSIASPPTTTRSPADRTITSSPPSTTTYDTSTSNTTQAATSAKGTEQSSSASPTLLTTTSTTFTTSLTLTTTSTTSTRKSSATVPPTSATTNSTPADKTTASTSSTPTPATSASTSSNNSSSTSSTTSTTIPSTTANETVSTSQTATSSTHKPVPIVKLSETNILLVDSSALNTMFVELEGKPNMAISYVWLVVRDAEKSAQDSLLLKRLVTGTLNDQGKLVLDESNGLDLVSKIQGVTSVVIALYSDETSADRLTIQNVMDSLVYSTTDQMAAGMKEVYASNNKYKFIADPLILEDLGDFSLSRCSNITSSNAAFVLANATKGAENMCTLTVAKVLEMKLSTDTCSSSLDTGFNDFLTSEIITGVNVRNHSGLALLMLNGMQVKEDCGYDKKLHIFVRFTVRSAFKKQLALVVACYKNFITDLKELQFESSSYLVSDCTGGCFPPETPPKTGGDNSVQVTVAVVISCICIFLVVLAAVIIYLKKKRKGILQFRMTRLDEEDDDLVGDMDDFVGNRGPTFRNFR